MKRNLLFSLALAASSLCSLCFASSLSAQNVSAIFEQNANGQLLSTDSCGTAHFASDNNLWTQSAATGTDCNGLSFVSDVSNWNIAIYPNGANFDITIGVHSVHLNESVAMGGISIAAGGTLALDANNSTGGGAHPITVGFNSGTLTNNGALTSIGPVEASQTYQFKVATLLTGAGTTTFGYGTVLNGPGILTVDTNQNVIGGGNVTVNTSLVNRGTITADGSTGFFEHREVSFASPKITNTGTIAVTTNGIIQFLTNTAIDNTGGTLSASGDWAFILNAGATVTGGTLVSTGDRPRADFFQVSNATLTGVNIATGTEMFVDGGVLTLNGAITNSGQIIFADTQNPAGTGRFNIASNTTLSGTGQITVAGSPNTIAAGKTLTLGAGQRLDAGLTIIAGAVTNQGLINATSDRGLFLNGGDLGNSGTMQSSGSGLLIFGGDTTDGEKDIFTIENAGGTIQALDSSAADFNGNITVRDGILDTAGTAAIYNDGFMTLENVTNDGTYHLRRNCYGAVTLQLSGSLTNNGVIDDLTGECNSTNINLLGDVSIDGTGSFVLYHGTTITSNAGGTNSAKGDTNATASAVLTNGPGHTINGNVTINPSLVNNGIAIVGGANTLILAGPSVTNNGTLEADPSGVIQQNANSTLTNYDAASQTLTGGTYFAQDGSLNLNIGPVVINAATVILSGTSARFDAINSILENRGIFEVNGGLHFSTATPPTNVKQIIAGDALSNFNALTVGSNSSITVNGNYTQGSIATLNIEIGPDNPTSGLNQLTVTGDAKLAGSLNVALVEGFTPAAGQTFQIVKAGAVSGNFAQVNGAEVTYTATGVMIHPNGEPIPASGQLQNISTRLGVLTGDSVSIAGFIVTGTGAKKIIIRGIGPSLSAFGVSGVLPDPVLELHAADSSLLASNNDWKDTDQAAIEETGLPPKDDLESAIVRTLDPGAYTAVLRGNNNSTGVGLIEAYDLAPEVNSKPVNISTRGFVDQGDNVMIGGFIVGPNANGGAKVVVRAIGPSLTGFGVTGALQDPTLELHDVNGALLTANDNWKDTEQDVIQATGLAPSDDRESVVVATLVSGPYTAIVSGANDTTGVGLVEVYNVQ